MLTDPTDISGGGKGYLKLDISVITKGEPLKIPQISEKEEDDIEGQVLSELFNVAILRWFYMFSNLLLPAGVTGERARAKIIVRIYRADGLPRMNLSVVTNLKQAFGAQGRDLVDPYVQVSFAGLTVG